MALWKEPPAKESNPTLGDNLAKDSNVPLDRVIERSTLEKVTATTPIETVRNVIPATPMESIIARDLVVEGKIEGAGHVRIAGKFKGDVSVQGNLTIEAGAQLSGEMHADAVIVGGELTGNIEAVSRVELSPSGVLNGDLKAGSLIVAAGSKMRGRVEFGWGGEKGKSP